MVRFLLRTTGDLGSQAVLSQTTEFGPQAGGHDRLLWGGPFRLRALQTTSAHSPSPEGELNPTSTEANVGSMKAPVRVADVDVGECRRGAPRSGEQCLAFDAGEELGGSDLEFE